jgi:hypothetical protein
MANSMFAAFAAVTLTVVGALDYTMQTRKADLAFGELGLGAYFETMGTRFAGMKAEQAAAAETGSLRRQEPRTLLPEAPEGWVMREWNEGDRSRLYPSRDTLATAREGAPEDFQEIYEHLENDPQFQNMAKASERMLVADEQRSIRFYQRGDSLIALKLDFNREASGIGLNGSLTGGVQQNAMDIIAGNMTAMSNHEGFAVVGGVAFGQSSSIFDLGDEVEDTGPVVRTLRGAMGHEVTISVRAMATDVEIRDLLAQIDYDTLNKLLTTPLANVGSNAPDIAPAEERSVADAAVDAEADAVIARGRQAEEDLIETGKALQGEGDTGLFGMFMQRANDERAAQEAEEAAAAAAPPAEGSLAALMAGNAPAEAAPAATDPAAAATAPAAAAPAVPAQEVRIRRAGSADGENCTMTATGKRCSLLGGD